MLDVIIVVVPIEPPMFEVRVFTDEERVFEVLRRVMVAEAEVKFVMFAEEMVVVANCDVPVALKVPVVRDVNDELEETLRVLFDQRRLEPAVIRVCGTVRPTATMQSPPRPFPRRHFLRGLGVALALPTLECLTPLLARDDAVAPRRMLLISNNLGVLPQH